MKLTPDQQVALGVVYAKFGDEELVAATAGFVAGLAHGIVQERARCAKVCRELVLAHPGRADLTAEQCAAAIEAGE